MHSAIHPNTTGLLRHHDLIVSLRYHSLVYNTISTIMPMQSWSWYYLRDQIQYPGPGKPAKEWYQWSYHRISNIIKYEKSISDLMSCRIQNLSIISYRVWGLNFEGNCEYPITCNEGYNIYLKVIYDLIHTSWHILWWWCIDSCDIKYDNQAWYHVTVWFHTFISLSNHLALKWQKIECSLWYHVYFDMILK
jgi:hypothetical protein